MGKMVLTSQYLSVATNDLSSYLRKCEVVVEVEEKEVTNMGSAGWKEYLGGLKSGTLSIELLADYAASAVDSILWPLFGTVVAFEVRPTSAVVGVSNPKWTGNVLVQSLQVIGGGVGDEGSNGVTWPTSGAVTRATA